MKHKKVALVLGSGGARGIAHIGVIRELLRQNYEITSIAGTSIGAMIGAIYASGKMDDFEHWMASRKLTDLLGMLDFTLNRQGFVKANKIMEELKKIVPDQRIEDLPIKYCAITTDIINRKEVVITKGSLYEAVRASVSFPVVFMPVRKNNTLYVDGGLLNPLPINRVHRQPDDIVVAVDLGAKSDYTKKNETNNKKEKKEEQIEKRLNMGKLELLNELVEVVLDHVNDLNLQLSPPDILVDIPKNARGVFDFANYQELIDLGTEQTQKRLSEFEQTQNRLSEVEHIKKKKHNNNQVINLIKNLGKRFFSIKNH